MVEVRYSHESQAEGDSIQSSKTESSVFVYILRCGDGTLYTGVARDVERRLGQHRRGKGARYTRGRGPLELVYREKRASLSDALVREAEIKRWKRARKEKLILEGAYDKSPGVFRDG